MDRHAQDCRVVQTKQTSLVPFPFPFPFLFLPPPNHTTPPLFVLDELARGGKMVRVSRLEGVGR